MVMGINTHRQKHVGAAVRNSNYSVYASYHVITP